MASKLLHNLASYLILWPSYQLIVFCPNLPVFCSSNTPRVVQNASRPLTHAICCWALPTETGMLFCLHSSLFYNYHLPILESLTIPSKKLLSPQFLSPHSLLYFVFTTFIIHWPYIFKNNFRFIELQRCYRKSPYSPHPVSLVINISP